MNLFKIFSHTSQGLLALVLPATTLKIGHTSHLGHRIKRVSPAFVSLLHPLIGIHREKVELHLSSLSSGGVLFSTPVLWKKTTFFVSYFCLFLLLQSASGWHWSEWIYFGVKYWSWTILASPEVHVTNHPSWAQVPAGVKAKIPSLSPLSTLPDRISLIGAKLLFRIFLMNNDLRWSRRSSRGNCQNKNLEKLDFKLRGVKGKVRKGRSEEGAKRIWAFRFCISI